MMSVSEQRAVQERENRKTQRRLQRDDLIEALDQWQGLSWRRDQLRKKINEAHTRRDLTPFDRNILADQLHQSLARVESDLITARERARGLQRGLE